MDNQKFEKKLEQIKTLNNVPVSIDDKIQKAYKQIDENEKGRNMEKQSKFKLNKVLSLAASFVIVVFLAGNGIAYAKGEDNIYSWILNKIGMQKEYEEKSQEIKINAISNETNIEVESAMINEEIVMVCYKINTNVPLKGKIYLFGNKYLNINNKKYDVEYENINIERENSTLSEKINENEYKVYEIYKLEDNEIAESVNLEVNISLIADEEKVYSSTFDIDKDIEVERFENEIEGKWNFKFDINKNSQTNYNYYEYKLVNNQFIFTKEILNLQQELTDNYETPKINIERIKKINNLNIIQINAEGTWFSGYVWKGNKKTEYGEEALMSLTIEIKDKESNKIILNKGIKRVLMGDKTEVILGDIDLKGELEINIYNDNKEVNEGNEDYKLIGTAIVLVK